MKKILPLAMILLTGVGAKDLRSPRNVYPVYSEKKENIILSNPVFSAKYLSKFNLSKNISLLPEKELFLDIPQKTLINLDSDILNLKSDLVKSIVYPFADPTIFYKFSYLLNNSGNSSKAKIIYDGNSILNIETDGNIEIRNGPFTTTSDGKTLNVKSSYGPANVIPMNIFLKKGNKIEDGVQFVDEKNYPPYFVSERLIKKDSIDEDDAKWILNSYQNLYGDYFKVNCKSLVCTDAATLIMKTAGISLGEELKKNRIFGDDYLQRNIRTIFSLIEKENLSKDVHLFEGGNLEKVLENGSYNNLTPENFGLKKFSPGQVIIFSRFYNSGKLKGKVQKKMVHLSVIYKTDGEKIETTSSVSSHKTEPPYDGNIKLGLTDFKEWYKRLENYTDSDETTESLKYRVYGIIDWLDVINHVKKDNSK